MEAEGSGHGDMVKEGNKKRESAPLLQDNQDHVHQLKSNMSRLQLEDHTKNYPIRFPLPGDSIDLMTHQINQMNHQNPFKNEINHFSHVYPLILTSLNDFKNVEKCEACIRPILDDAYACMTCNFFIHKLCSELADEIDHPFHRDHPLMLLPGSTSTLADFFDCNVCATTCNGFAYACPACDFYLDVFCSFLSDNLVHEFHQHPLNIIFNHEHNSVQCSACHKPVEIAFGCKPCGFNLDIHCVLNPQIIRQGCDDHALKLKYSPPEGIDSEIDHHCNVCKEDLRIQDCWFYYCDDCDKGCHSRCIWNVDLDNELIKFGKKIQLKGHPHPLTLVKKVEKEPTCCYCGHPYDGLSFECHDDSVKCRYVRGGRECRYNLDGFCAHVLDIVEYENQDE